MVHWDIESGQELGRKRIPGATYLWDLDISPDGTSIVFVGERTNSLDHYDIETLRKIETITLPSRASIK